MPLQNDVLGWGLGIRIGEVWGKLSRVYRVQGCHKQGLMGSRQEKFYGG